MNRTLKFNKESSGRWFVDLPEWTGSKDDLEMVLGADDLLNIIAQGEQSVEVYFSTEPFEESNVISWFKEGMYFGANIGGGFYKLHQYKGIVYDADIWLCDVAKFVFGETPQLIYFK